MKPYLLAFCGALAAFPALAADFSAIDVGDVYYINRFGKNNSTVVVERKLDAPKVKVRDMNTYATSVEDADRLLSETELRQAETKNKTLGWGQSGWGFSARQAAASKPTEYGTSPRLAGSQFCHPGRTRAILFAGLSFSGVRSGPRAGVYPPCVP